MLTASFGHLFATAPVAMVAEEKSAVTGFLIAIPTPPMAAPGRLAKAVPSAIPRDLSNSHGT